MSWRRRLSIVLAIASVAVGAFLLQTQVLDPRLPREDAARQLRERLGVEWTFVCLPASNDGTLPADIDYRCDPSRAEQVSYWIETDRSTIEIVGVTG